MSFATLHLRFPFHKQNMRTEPIYVTQPYLPPLEEFMPYLQHTLARVEFLENVDTTVVNNVSQRSGTSL